MDGTQRALETMTRDDITLPEITAWERVSKERYDYWFKACCIVLDHPLTKDALKVYTTLTLKEDLTIREAKWKLPTGVCLFEQRYPFTPRTEYIIYWPAVNRLIHEASLP